MLLHVISPLARGDVLGKDHFILSFKIISSEAAGLRFSAFGPSLQSNIPALQPMLHKYKAGRQHTEHKEILLAKRENNEQGK